MSVLKTIKDKTFDSKEAFFKALKEKKEDILKEKKAKHKLTTSKELPLIKESVLKSPFPTEKGFFYPIINSTNVMDSHDDVHLDTVWNKSAVEKNGKTFYVVDHDLSVNGLAVHKSDVEIQLHRTSFKSIGYDLEGDTTLLVYKMPEDAILHDKLAKIVANKGQIENSVRMEYVNTVMCVDSESEELKEEKKDYDKYIDQVANRDEVEKQGYFFAVSEAKIIDEGSGVLKGSNSATHIIYHQEDIKEIEPSKDTQNEPLKDTHNQIDYKSLSEKFKKLRNE